MPTLAQQIEADSPGKSRHAIIFDPVIMLALIAIAVSIFACWYQLARASLWFDEGYTAWVISLSPARLLHVIRADTAPPFYYLLLHGWSLALGRSEFALRSFSALCTTLSLLLMYPVARRLLRDHYASAAAVILFSLGCLQAAYAHEARFYALMTLLELAGLWAVLSAVEKPTIFATARIIVLWTAALYTNNLMLLYVAGLAAAWLLLPGKASRAARIRDVLTACIAVFVLYIPWIIVLLHQAQAVQNHFWIARPSGWELQRTIAALSGVNEQGITPLPARFLIVLTAILAACLLAALLNRRMRDTAWVLALIGIGPILLIFMISEFAQPIFIERGMIASSAILPLILALPARINRSAGRLIIFLAIILGVADLRSWRTYHLGEHTENWRDVARYVAADANADAHTRVVFVSNEGELLYDYYARGSDYSRSDQLTGAPADFFAAAPPRTLMQVLDKKDLDPLQAMLASDSVRACVLVQSHTDWADPDGRTQSLIARHMLLKNLKTFRDIKIFMFVRRP